MEIRGSKYLSAVEGRVNSGRGTVRPSGPGIRQPKVVSGIKKKTIVPQRVNRVASASIPPFGSQTIPSRKQSVTSNRSKPFGKRAQPQDRLLGFIKAANARYSD